MVIKFNVSVRHLALLILVVFAISSVIIYNSSFSDQSPSWSHQNSLPQNIEDIDDYDAACSGYSVGRILREQKRILASVRTELAESQTKIEEIRSVQEELQRLIPQKQLELSSLEGEIEAAQRQLEELRETQNVRVFLPLSPLQVQHHKSEISEGEALKSFDDAIDYSFCSISTFMPVHVESITNGEQEKQWAEAFKKEALHLVKDPQEACLKIRVTNGSAPKNDSNVILFNVGSPLKNTKAIVVQSSEVRSFDFSLDPPSISTTPDVLPSLLPLSRSKLVVMMAREEIPGLDGLKDKGIAIRKCWKEACNRSALFKSSTFCFLPPCEHFQSDFLDSLRSGCIPIVLSNSQPLPFENLIDWRRAVFRIPMARLPESHFIVRSFETADILEMRRMGRILYENYLSSRNSVARTLLSAMRFRLHIPTNERLLETRATPLFNTSFTSPKGSAVSLQPNFDDEYLLGPLESRVPSVPFSYNFTEFQMYSYDQWNVYFSPHRTKQFLLNAAEPPAEAEFYEDTRTGFRPIEPGSGVEFSKALGGNRPREQFTVVLLTFERDAVLAGALERLHQLPYLHKVLVVWNNVHREPPDTWPSLHVPVEFVRVAENSLNNRFVPWDRVETEAVLSLDDDIDLMQQEIVLAFRVWRENRDRIVGFPARFHARYGDAMYYNSNHTCQMSMILTGAAFVHKNYLAAYTHQMPSAIREHVDSVKNCEDIAMNYLVSHLTRKPPIKTTSRWTLKCPTCTESLFKEDDHFEKRHECMRLFTKIYGYNPLRFSQFRADSILFKTRLPQNHQKCFKYV